MSFFLDLNLVTTSIQHPIFDYQSKSKFQAQAQQQQIATAYPQTYHCSTLVRLYAVVRLLFGYR